MLLRFPGVIRLIEFKSAGNRSSKERTRQRVIRAALEASPQFLPVSREVHWYIETEPSIHDGILARFLPYIDAFDVDVALDRLESFIAELAREVVGGTSSAKEESEAAEYLRWVAMTHGEGTAGSGGVLLLADASGALRYGVA